MSTATASPDQATANQEEASRWPKVVSFSGIDGSGKSTQIQSLCTCVLERGASVRVVRFWDDVATLGRVREFLSHNLFGGDKGVGSPQRPVARRDKNVQAWYMTPLRLVLYSLDALRLTALVLAARRSNNSITVFDRYIYDELANLPMSNLLTRLFVRLMLKVVPSPDIAFLLDADPEEARGRKPEYPVEFLHRNRASYLAIHDLAGNMVRVPPLPPEEVACWVREMMEKRFPPSPACEEITSK